MNLVNFTLFQIGQPGLINSVRVMAINKKLLIRYEVVEKSGWKVFGIITKRVSWSSADINHSTATTFDFNMIIGDNKFGFIINARICGHNFNEIKLHENSVSTDIVLRWNLLEFVSNLLPFTHFFYFIFPKTIKSYHTFTSPPNMKFLMLSHDSNWQDYNVNYLQRNCSVIDSEST